MRAILDIIIYALDLYKLVIVAGAVLSWLIAFSVVNIRNDFVRSMWNLFLALTNRYCVRYVIFCPIPAESTFHRSSVAGGDTGRADSLFSSDPLCNEPNDLIRPKTAAGRIFRGFLLGEALPHATPHTLTTATLRFIRRFTARVSPPSPPRLSHPPSATRKPGRRLLAFHIVFGKTVGVSLNAIANLGYADCRFSRPVYCGRHAVRGLAGHRAQGELGPAERRRPCPLEGVQPARRGNRRIRTLGDGAKARCRRGSASRPRSGARRGGGRRRARRGLSSEIVRRAFDDALSGSPHRFEDYLPGERIDHIDGVTVEEAEHQIAARLFQNTAKVHFNQFTEGQGRFGRRLIYGGHVISFARALSFNGFANAFHIAAINGGRHMAPLFAGDTVFAWSEMLETAALPGRDDVGALSVRTVATKNRPCADFPCARAGI